MSETFSNHPHLRLHTVNDLVEDDLSGLLHRLTPTNLRILSVVMDRVKDADTDSEAEAEACDLIDRVISALSRR